MSHVVYASSDLQLGTRKRNRGMNCVQGRLKITNNYEWRILASEQLVYRLTLSRPMCIFQIVEKMFKAVLMT